MAITVIRGRGPRAATVCQAMCEGVRHCGTQVHEIMEEYYSGVHYDVAIFYGLFGKCRQAFNDYRKAGKKAVYVDLGYWGRTEGGKLYGYHKVSVNDRHPTAYFQNRLHSADRFSRFGLEIKPWRKDGRHILVAGMGIKAASVEGFPDGHAWEHKVVEELRRHTDRTIIYRPKPSWGGATGIPGTVFSPREQRLEEVLRDCWAVVTHHSNVACDALLEGIPVFCEQGVAKPMGHADLAKIETPLYPDWRSQWAWDVAYCQWTPSEMRSGEVWRHLKNEGLVP